MSREFQRRARRSTLVRVVAIVVGVFVLVLTMPDARAADPVDQPVQIEIRNPGQVTTTSTTQAPTSTSTAPTTTTTVGTTTTTGFGFSNTTTGSNFNTQTGRTTPGAQTGVGVIPVPGRPGQPLPDVPLPKTGPDDVSLRLLLIGVLLVELGWVLWSSSKPARVLQPARVRV